MTRFLVYNRVNKIPSIFNADIKSVYVLSNVDRKYYQCIPKRRRRSDFKAEMYSWFIQRRGGTIASLFFLSENSHSPKAPRDIEIGLHRP